MSAWAKWLCVALAGVVVGVVLVTVPVTQQQREHQIYTRVYRVDDLAAVHPTYPETDDALLRERFGGDDPIEIMEKVRNAVPCVARGPASEDPTALAAWARGGGGLVCSGMANLYRGALAASGFDARVVGLSRSLLDRYDSHATVEIYQDGRWVIYDPTFGIAFSADGRFLGAQELKSRLVDGGIEDVELVELVRGTTYDERIEDYYMSWESLFDNVTVRDPATALWQKLPIVRWWRGDRLYYERLEGHRADNIAFMDTLYWYTSVVMPAILVAALVGIALLCVYSWLARRRNAGHA